MSYTLTLSNPNDCFHYDSTFYPEFDYIITNELYKSPLKKVFNKYAFFGNVCFSHYLSTTFYDNIKSVTISENNEYDGVDFQVITKNDRHRLIEIKTRLDDDYVKYPLTCLGEELKYNNIKLSASTLNAEPYMCWINAIGEGSIFNITKYKPAKWKPMMVPFSQFGKRGYIEKSCGLFERNQSYQFKVPDYDKILKMMDNLGINLFKKQDENYNA